MSKRWQSPFLSGHINFQVLAMVREPGRITLRLSKFWRVMYVLSALTFGVVAPVAAAVSWQKARVQPWHLLLAGAVAAGCWVWLYYLLFRRKRIEIAIETGEWRLYSRSRGEPGTIIGAGEIERLEMRGSGLRLHTRDGKEIYLFHTNQRRFVEGVLEALSLEGPLAEIAKAAGKTQP